jgi:hypothetical protein
MKRLTIGMATHSDMEGVYWTVQGIRMNHPEVQDDIEFLILDNSPEDSPHKRDLSRFVKWVTGVPCRLEHTSDSGTAIRGRLFEMATTPYVLCMDSHVMLTTGSLRKLIDGMDAGHDHGHLLQGPMLADNMQVMATHMAHVWRDGMLGIWSIAWRCPCGSVFQSAKREDGKVNWLELQTMDLPHRAISCCLSCGKSIPVLHWDGHESYMKAAGFSPAADGEAFEVPAQGLGLFACRKDAWLGFHPGFREFGGEECYIHEKYRQAGKTTVCLPFLKWLHRFWRPAGASYPAHWESRIMNYLLGYLELGMNTDEVLLHFSSHLGKTIDVDWDDDGWPVGVRIHDRL